MSRRQEAFEKLEEPQERGDAAEAIVTGELVARGVSVLVPMYDNDPYDLVLNVKNGYVRVQVKTAYLIKPGVVCFETRSTRVKSDGYERESYDGKIDYFVVYSPPTDEIYVVHIDEASRSGMWIRFVEAKNNQRSRVNWHEEYVLDARLPELLAFEG